MSEDVSGRDVFVVRGTKTYARAFCLQCFAVWWGPACRPRKCFVPGLAKIDASVWQIRGGPLQIPKSRTSAGFGP